MNKNIVRSIGAVLAGAFTGIVLSVGTDMLLRAVGVFPPFDQTMSDALFVLATVYRTVYGVAGGYITARLAPNRPMAHALVLGAIGTAACIVGAVSTWDKMPEIGPKWYALVLIVLAMPPAWAGAKLREMQLRTTVDG